MPAEEVVSLASPSVCCLCSQVTKEGYEFPFVRNPLLTNKPMFLLAHRNDPVKRQTIQEEVDPGFYSRIFLVPKVTGGWRPTSI